MASSIDNAWLRIPAGDYEAHMAQIGQSAALRAIFARVYAETRPHRALVLGCTTGKDLAQLDPAATTRAVGVDVNPDYLAIARDELARRGRAVELVQGDVVDVDVGSAEFDLVYAALVVEYVEPVSVLRRVGTWLAPSGVCVIVSQDSIDGVASVSETLVDSLRLLESRMSLVAPDELRAIASTVGLARTTFEQVPLPGGKSFSVSTFGRTRAR
jgi:SAM-dependent methyltransferase